MPNMFGGDQFDEAYTSAAMREGKGMTRPEASKTGREVRRAKPKGQKPPLPGALLSQVAPNELHVESEPIEYVTVSDTNSKVIHSGTDLGEHRRLVGKIRKCGGQATIFKALKF